MNEITIEELRLLSKFTVSELDLFIKSLKVLISNQGGYDNPLKTDVIQNCQEITTFLPKCTHLYLEQSIPKFRKIMQIMTLFIQSYPNHPFNPSFTETITVICQHFKQHSISEELSLSQSPQELDSDEDESRPLHERVVNPNKDENKEYAKMIKEMVRSAKSRGESNADWRALAEGIKGKSDGTSPQQDAIAELLLSGVNRLEEREKQFALSKIKVSELSNSPVDKALAKKKRWNKLLDAACDNIIHS